MKSPRNLSRTTWKKEDLLLPSVCKHGSEGGILFLPETLSSFITFRFPLLPRPTRGFLPISRWISAIFYLRRSRQIRERKALFFFFFFFLLLLGGPFFSLPCAVFWGVKRQKTLSKKGCDKTKTLSKKGCDKAKTLSQKGCEKAITLSQKGCEKAKTSSKILFSTPQISESIPFLFYWGEAVQFPALPFE